jgi:hypothetical protein
LSFKQLLIYSNEAEWTPFQTHYYSEYLVAPGMEPDTSGSVTRISAHILNFMKLDVRLADLLTLGTDRWTDEPVTILEDDSGNFSLESC